MPSKFTDIVLAFNQGLQAMGNISVLVQLDTVLLESDGLGSVETT